MTPRSKYILIKPDPPEGRQTQHGILTPQNTEQEQKAYGEVVAVGSSIEDIKAGDKVVFGKFAGDELKKDGETYMIVHDDYVLLIL